jgi:hypothetical protein
MNHSQSATVAKERARRNEEGSQPLRPTHRIIDDPHDQRATRAFCDILPVPQVELGDLKPVAARAGEVVDPLELVPDEILDFDLVVVGYHVSNAKEGEVKGGG